MAETLITWVTRIEKNIAEITKKQSHLDDLVKILLDAQIKTEQRFQETDKRFAETDKEIADLVIAIGELIGRMPPVAPKIS